VNWRVPRSRNTSAMSDKTRPENHKREVIVALSVIIVIVCTPIISLALHPTDTHQEVITVGRGEYYAMSFVFHGFGTLDYSYSAVGGWDNYLITLDERNYERFIAGEPYDCFSFARLESGGEGESSDAGFKWVLYVVFVNEGSSLTIIEFESVHKVYFDIVVGVGLSAMMAFVAFAARKRRPEGLVAEGPARFWLKRGIALVIAGLAALPFVPLLFAYLFMPISIHAFWLMLVYWSFNLGIITSVAITFLLRFRLTAVEGESEHVLSDLTHRLRISGFRVSEKRGQLIVATSSIACVKVNVRQASETTIVYYRPYATPTGWSVILILLLFIYVAPAALAVSLYLLYNATVFASNRILPRLSQLPIPTLGGGDQDTRAILIDGLSEGRRLSAEAYEAARSRYHDHILIMVTICLVTALLVTLLMAIYTPREVLGMEGISFSLLMGFVAALIFVVVTWRFLESVASPLINDLQSWKDRLELALARETTSGYPLDGEPISSFELLTDASREIPKWMEIRRKAGMFRQPLQWLLIFILAYFAVMTAVYAVTMYMDHPLWSGGFAISALLGGLAAAVYLRWRKNTREEIESIVEEWGKRHDKLMADMEAFVRSV
jgi:hypothetical protein